MAANLNKSPARRRPFWILTTYFAEGFPYSLVRQVSAVFFKDTGASLEAIGLTSLYGLPWAFKFAWAPFLDAFATRRRWLIVMESILAILMLALAAGSLVTGALAAMAVLFFLAGIAAATHDIAVDGYYLEALDRNEQARWVGFQAMSFRLALIAGGGGLIYFSSRTAWWAAFFLAALLLGMIAGIHRRFIPRTEIPGRSAPDLFQTSPGFYARAFTDYLSQPRIGVTLGFLILFRLGDSSLLAMVYPFLSDIGIDRGQFGVAYGTVGIAASIAGAIAGGWLIARFGLRRTIWPLTLCQNVPNLLYMFLAFHYRGVAGHRASRLLSTVSDLNFLPFPNLEAAGDMMSRPELYTASFTTVTAIVALEALGTGLGTAAFMVFIMRTCRPRFKAAHMAMGTGVMNIASTLAGAFSGWLAARFGFPLFFAFTFLITVPSMLCIGFLPVSDAPAPQEFSGPAAAGTEIGG